MTVQRRIGFTLLRNTEDSPLSPHFGMAKWLGIFDTASGEMQLVRNTGLNGRFVAEQLQQAGCTDAVFASIGAGALEHLKARGIQAHRGPTGVSAKLLVQELERGQLPLAESAGHLPPRRRREQAAHRS